MYLFQYKYAIQVYSTGLDGKMGIKSVKSACT